MNSGAREKAILILRYNKIINCMLILFIFVCILSYMYLANSAVRTLTLLEKSKEDMQSLSLEVGDMESRRLLVDHSLGKALAASLGFVEASPTFIVKNSKKTTLSFKTD